jgi:adenylate kinase
MVDRAAHGRVIVGTSGSGKTTLCDDQPAGRADLGA